MSRFDNAVATTSSVLCEACRAIFTGSSQNEQIDPAGDNYPNDEPSKAKPLVNPRGTHHVTASACKDSADRSCPICRTVWLRATEYGKVKAEDLLELDLQTFSSWNVSLDGERSAYAESSGASDGHILTVNIGNVLSARGLGIVQTFTYGDVVFHLEPAVVHQVLLSDPVTSSDTSSEVCWQLVEQWHEYCRTHCMCVGQFSNILKPKRLIDLGESAEDVLYIRSADTLPEEVSYVCLSHSWGGFMAEALYDPGQEWNSGRGIPITDVDKQGFRLGEESKTFKDAVEITRRLGKRYLWIDMLCIIQNDKIDWLQESENMGRLYAGAYLTLIADGARDARNGLFRTRKPGTVNPMVVRPDWKIEKLSNQDWVIVPVDFWRETVSESRTGRRAWCLQERWLSNASIHFTDTQIAWECKDTEFCETFALGLPSVLQDEHARFSAFSKADAKRLRQLSKAPKTEISKAQKPHDAEDIQGADEELEELEISDKGPGDSWELDKYYLWSQLIEKYARTDITRDTDRLAAVFGLADFYSRLLDDDFISGLWFSILPSQLLWTIDSGYRSAIIHAPDDAEDLSPWQPRGIRPSTRNAPTWSWASVKGPLIMPTPLKEGAQVDLQILPNRAAGDPPNLRSIIFQEQAILVATGVLHCGLMGWNGRWNRWSMFMNKVGFGSRHTIENGVKVQKFPLPPYRETTDPAQIRAGSHHPFARSPNPSSAPSPSEPPPKADHIFGLANPDTDQSVLDPKEYNNTPFPILCLPVMDTKNHGKHALHPDVSFAIRGISGLMLAPVPGGPQGMYIRLGTFDLAGDGAAELGVSFGDDGQDGLFMRGGHRAILLL